MTVSTKYDNWNTPMPANTEYRRLLNLVLCDGHETSPRNISCLEVLNGHTVVSMNYPLVTLPSRKIGNKFRFAEAWWILSGRNDVESISAYSADIKGFSNDGEYFDGAYGPKVVDQLSGVASKLRRDPSTRQAIISIWRENLRDSKDTPCTLSLQFLIRGGALHCVASMRSSDLWLGWPYDVFNFTAITRRVQEMIQLTASRNLGYLMINAGSLHLYGPNQTAARALTKETGGYARDGYFDWYKDSDRWTITERLAVLKDDPTRA